MKVLHVNSEKSWRGGEQQMAYLIEELSKNGVENFICCRTDSMMSEYAKKNGIEQLNLSFSGMKFINSLSLIRFVSKQNFDVIHTHTANAHTLAYYASLAGMKNPIVVSKRTDFKVKTPRKFNLENIKAILCVSKKIQQITREKVKNKSIVHTVYSGINLERFYGEQKSLKELLELNLNKPLIGNTSAIADQKDYFTFVNTAKRLPDYNFVIIGSGPMENEIKDFVKKSGAINVYFTGFLDNLEMYLKSLDLFLITSKTEGLGTSILDAMVCKVPVVATRAGGIPEIVIDQQTGMLCDIGDDEHLAKQIVEVLNNESTKNLLVNKACENVSQHFSKEQTAKLTLEIYQS